MSSKISGDNTHQHKTERLNEMAYAFKNAATLIGAVELDLFTAISEGAGTFEEIAQRIGIEAEAAERLIIVCQALNLIGTADGRFQCFDDVERYLVRGKPGYFGEFLVYQPKDDQRLWQDVAQNIRGEKGTVPPEPYYFSLMADPAAARTFTEAGYNSSIGLAHKLAKNFDFSRFKRWLDLGGGSGCYSIAACERHPGLRTIVMDQPNVVPVTRDFVAKHKLQDRIDIMTGNFFETEYPADCDLISFITPLQSYMPGEIIKVLKKTHAALKPGGAVLIVDYMLKDDKTGPLDSALMNLQGIRNGHYMGRVNSGAEWKQFLTEAGFQDVGVEWLMQHQLGQIHAWKSA